jgi:pyruvate dehydrogenase E1 component alpha subunit
LHECLNIAQLKTIPVLFVCENNGWSEFSPTSTQVTFTLEKLAAAYGIRYSCADGSDVEAVAAIAADAILLVRRQRGPIVLEFSTTRIRGHYEGDSQKYRNDKAPPADPLAVAHARLEARAVSVDELDMIEQEARARVQAAVEAARLSAEPTLQSAAEDVYAVGAWV